MADPVNTPLPTCVTALYVIAVDQTIWTYAWICIGTTGLLTRWFSRLLKVIWTDTDQL